MLQLNNPTTVVRITSIDEKVLTEKYHGNCMECGFCADSCCYYGCPADISEVDRIMKYRDELEKRTGVPASQWFSEEVEYSDGFPNESIRRTRVHNGKCVFLSRTGRGCHIHAMALEKGMDPHDIKPLICFLFPLTWDKAHLYVSEFLSELPCRGEGVSILECQMPDLKLYFGEKFVEEVRQIQKKGLAAVK